MRLFIGVPAPKTRLLRNLKNELARWKRHVKVVSPEHWHVTTHFLGERDKDEVPGIIKALNVAAKQIQPRKLVMRGIGAFPEPQRYSVLYVAVVPGEPLIELHDALLEPLGLPEPEREYHPHVTVARARKGSSARDASGWIDPVREFGELKMERVVLFESNLTETGPVYTRLHEQRLLGKPL